MSEPREEIMEATKRALSKHSYSELSIQNIADEFDKSKSLLYHHYDGKDEILLDFLDYILEDFEDKAFDSDCTEKQGKFKAVAFMTFNLPEEDDFLKTIIELRTQSIREEKYREKFKKFEKSYREVLENLLNEKLYEEETNKDINVENASEFIFSLNNEAMFRRAYGGDVEGTKNEMEKYIQQILK